MKRHKLKLAIAGLIAFLAGFFSAVRLAPAQTIERFDMKVRQDFFAGFSGDKEALARGMKSCEDILAENPKYPEALVWHGGGVLFQAGAAFQSGDQAKGMEMWTRGLNEMQTAVDLAPDNVGVRIPRGAVLLASSHYVPDAQMARPLIENGVADYVHTYDLQKGYFTTIGTHPRGELLFGIAEGYGRLGDQAKAAKFFEKIRADLPNTPYAKRAALWMETKSLPVELTQCVGCHVPGK